MLGYYCFFLLFSVDQPFFNFSSGAYLLRVTSNLCYCNLWVFLGNLLPN
jgi:Zn-dependent protease